jgi:2-succinyl-5-enolpyruvyl-6-hydroxy-3-cyclohexene-1-carboxylate synthase
VLAVVGAGVGAEVVAACDALDWAVVGDATGQGTLAYADPLLRDDEWATRARPDLVVRLGGMPASRVLAERLGSWSAPVVAMRGAGPVADPDGVVCCTVDGLPDAAATELAGDSAYARMWRDCSARVGEWLEQVDSSGGDLDEPMVARAVVAACTRYGAPLVVGSSMPVRDVEWWAPPRRTPTYANRGANGIDGVVSTALGVACGSRAIGLVGDLTMLHDVSGLVDGLGPAGGTCVLVVVDNDGGAIFSFLPQAATLAHTEFERLFATPRGHDLAAVARGFAHAAVTVSTREELRASIDAGLASPGLTVVVARVVSREENVRRHDALVNGVKSHRDPGPA